MEHPKTQGNLRDFRIDRSSPDSSRTETQRSVPAQSVKPTLTPIVAVPRRANAAPVRKAAAPAPTAKPLPKAPVELPRQSVRKNVSANKPNGSMKEWSSGANSAQENLWDAWDQDAGVEMDLSSPVGRAEIAPVIAREAQLPSEIEVSVPHSSRSNLSEVTPPSEHEREIERRTLQSEQTGKKPWSIELAFDERRAERLGLVDFTNSYRKQELLKTRTLEFMGVLQTSFREHIELFNEARRNPGSSINIYKVSKTAEDFMLFRNGVKLIVSGQRAGLVTFAFNQFVGQIFAPNQQPITEIEASWGPFEQLYWSYKGERVQLLDLVRYFMTELVRQSFR